MSRGKRKLADGASISEHARRLRQRPGWDPGGRREELHQEVRRRLGELRVDEIAQRAASCEACARAQGESGDAGALCREHLAQAMGFTPA